jgi:hypothetical protein
MLPVALGHLDDLGRDRDELAAALLHAVPAAFAYREGYLIARASSVPRTLEHLTAKEQDGSILVKGFVSVAPNHRHCFAKGREHLARQVEPEHVSLRADVGSIVRAAPRAMSRN